MGRLTAIAQLAQLAILGALAFFAWRYFQGKSVFDVARDLKEKTPLGVPARAIDSAISSSKGYDETLGGALADWFAPQAVKNISTPVQLPHETAGVANVGVDWTTSP